jgi:2-dehydropantoate 2-reductase
MARVAIIGPGAIGGTVAAHLEAAGRHEIILCSRRPIAGLIVETPTGTLRCRLRVLTEPALATPVDFVLVATKTYDVAPTAAWLSRLAPAGVPVAILQNGVQHRELFAAHLADEQVVPVIVWLTAERRQQDVIYQRSAARLAVGESLAGRALADLFAGTGIAVETTGDFRSAAWRKLCGNSAGIINAIIRQPTGALRDERIAELARAIVRESAAVGRAEGAVLADDIAETVVRGLVGIAPDSLNSMQIDREAGRPLEIEARNGIIVRLGRKHGIPTPRNETAVTLLEAMIRQDRHA